MLGDGTTPTHNEEALEPRWPDQKKERKILFIVTSGAEWCLSNRTPPPLDGITTTNTRKGWRDSGDILAMKNNQNVQNTY